MIINDSIVLNEVDKKRPNWKTIKGTHVLVNKDGKIIGGPDNLRSEDADNKRSKSSSTGPDPWAEKVADLITRGANWINNNVHPFRR